MDKAIEAAARAYANVAGENPWEDGLRAAIAAYLRNVEASEGECRKGLNVFFDYSGTGNRMASAFKAMCAAKADELEKQNG